jgi:hypothetical protein
MYWFNCVVVLRYIAGWHQQRDECGFAEPIEQMPAAAVIAIPIKPRQCVNDCPKTSTATIDRHAQRAISS